MRCFILAVACQVALSWCAAAAETPAEGAIATTHVVTLKNGASIRCTVVAEDSARIVATIGSRGKITLSRAEIASVRAEAGILAPRKAPAATPNQQAPPAPEPVPAPRAETAAPAAAPDLTPPPIPGNLRDEIDHWIYHLGRTRGKNRIQAERNLKALGPVVVGPVLPFAHRPEALIRCAALRIIAETRHPAGVATIWNALADENEVVRQVAHENLVKVTGLGIHFNPAATARSRALWIEKWRAALAEAKLLP